MNFYAENLVTGGLNADYITSILGIVGAVPMAVAILFVTPLCNKFGKQKITIIGMAIGVVGGIIAGIRYDNMAVAAVGIAMKCLGSAPAGYMILAMIADSLDHIEARTGKRCDGFVMSIYSSIMIASTPVAQGIAWIPPEERLRLVEEEADRLAEEARKDELKARCEKKGLDFETEEAKYQQKLAEKQAKKQKK